MKDGEGKRTCSCSQLPNCAVHGVISCTTQEATQSVKAIYHNEEKLNATSRMN